MNRQPTILLHILWLCLTIGILGCGEESSPAPRTAPVSKKITMPSKPKQAADDEVKRDASSTTDTKPEAEAASAGNSPAKAEVETSQLVQDSLKIASSYDSTGRFDPFEPLFKDQPQEPSTTRHKDKREKRIPQTYLETVSLSQLKLTAILQAPGGNSALVEDATGKGYVIHKGTYIGLNSGRVIEIGNDKVVVEEEIENVMGEIEIQNEELKLQKPAGEL